MRDHEVRAEPLRPAERLKIDFDLCLARIQALVRRARPAGTFVRLDMEDSSCTSPTIDLYRRLRAGGEGVGVVLQAYMRRSLNDVRDLPDGANVRLCKGIYVEPPEIAYAANPGFAGYDKFLFAVTDGRPETRIGVVSISVGSEDASGGPDLPDGADDEPDDEETPEVIEEVPGPGQNPPGLKESTTKARADKSNVMVLLDWNHQNKEHGIESTVHLQFAEHRTRTSLESHVWYDLVMLDENNNELMRKNDLVALDSEDMQKISFPAEGTYHFEVNVKGLIDKSSNEITRNTDYTGKALGTVVVPEFGSAFMLLLAASALAAMMLFARYRRLFDRTFDY